MSAVLGKLNLDRLAGLAASAGKAADPPPATDAAEKDKPHEEAETAPETPETPEAGEQAADAGEEEETAPETPETPEAGEQAADAGEIEALRAKVAELETALTRKEPQPVQVAPVHPLLAEDDPAKIADAERQLEQFERWALENWDGTEAVEAAGDQPAIPAYPAQAIRKRYAELKTIRERVIPQARELAARRKALTAEARAVYPELFDPKREEYSAVTEILQYAPGLKAVLPNIYLVLGDALRGEKLRLEQARKAKTPARPAAPKVPARPAAAAARPAATPPKSKGPDPARFVAAGGDRAALVNMLRGMDLPTGRAEE